MLHCLAHGQGKWVLSEKPAYYTLSDEFLPNFNRSRWFWGTCGARSLTHEWLPSGEGCSRMPSVAEMTYAFEAAYSGKRVLFIGDSTQGQFFTSLVHTIGFNANATVHNATGCPDTRREAFRRCNSRNDRGDIERNNLLNKYDEQKMIEDQYEEQRIENPPYAHEVDMIVETKGGVVMQFIRHETLVPDEVPSSACQWRGWRCPFLAAAGEADLIMLNVGYHGQGTPNTTLSALQTVKKPDAQIAFRSTHSPVCDDQVWLADSGTPPGRNFTKYNWQHLQEYNSFVFHLAKASVNVHYLDIWTLSNTNGQGRFMPPDADCVHQCLPGPIDEWSKLFLAFAHTLCEKTRKSVDHSSMGPGKHWCTHVSLRLPSRRKGALT